MPLLDIEKEITKLSSSEEEKSKLRQAACIGLKSGLQEVERQLSNAKMQLDGFIRRGDPQDSTKVWIAALEESLIYLRAMLYRAEKGNETHSSSSVQD